MKRLKFILFLTILSLFVSSFAIFAQSDKKDANYPPKAWVTDIHEAYNIAQNENKNILINFTGSDWCVWCHRLSDEVFSTTKFKKYADENLVLLFLDFPNKRELSSKQQLHNQLVAQMLGIKGYPSVWLLDKDLSPLLVTGYKDGGAENYVSHLKEDRISISEEESKEFRVAFKKTIEDNLGSF